MHLYRSLVAVLLHLAALLLVSSAQAAPNHITAKLVVEGPAAPGRAVTVAITMQPEQGWHGYWKNPGDAGLGLTLDWSLPRGWSAGDLLYPVPQAQLYQGLMNHVYATDYAVLVPITLPAQAALGQSVPITVKAQWLACTEQICVPESADLTTSITLGSGTADPRFDRWRASLPAPLGAQVHFAISGQTIRLAIPLPASLPLQGLHLFPETDHIVAYAAPQEFRRKGDLLLVSVKRPDLAALDPQSIAAVLRLDAAGGVTFTAVPGPVPTGGDLVEDHKGTMALPLLLLAALAGGLLLNIMPCVFPILSLKALSLARAGESAREARAEGLAYSAGVVLACLILGGTLLALRAAGQEVGWAFQLQEPSVVVALLLLAAAITANLIGLYEIAIPGFARAGSPKGAFATGLLAAFVATPCTGPFMAAAMGAALLLPVPEALMLFAALGIGIALPFLAIAYVPALRRLLPKPGAWMVWFRKAMALPMGLTALALIWLCWRLGDWPLAGGSALLALLLIGVLIGVGRAERQGKMVPKSLILAGAALFLLGTFALPRFAGEKPPETASILSAQPFSPAALAKARATGKPVFVYFTADWCLTCKVNEGAAIEREETRAAFAKAGVIVLVGDWTRRDPVITRFLSAQNAAGVPLYLWYAPHATAPAQLPQVLTPSLLAAKTES